MISLHGHWKLERYGYVNDELEYDDNDSAQHSTAMRRWLLGSEMDLDEATQPGAGLEITIDGDSFNEQVYEFRELMFDNSGVQVNDYRPMVGKVKRINGIGFLIPANVTEHDLPGPTDSIAARYDDGDTKVCDTIRIAGEHLVRQISVVTDEHYVDRIVLVYCPTADN